MKSNRKHIFHVSPRYLLFTAGAVWIFAGFNIVRLGLKSTSQQWTPLAVVASIATFSVFFGMIFHKLVRKHTLRISTFKERRVHILRFFDAKSYIIMAVMMSAGILIRNLGLWPPYCIKIFYTGLGLSLAAAGAGFLLNFSAMLRRQCFHRESQAL